MRLLSYRVRPRGVSRGATMKGESFATNARVDSRLHAICLGPWSERRRNPRLNSWEFGMRANRGELHSNRPIKRRKRGRSTRPGIEVGQI